MTVFLFGLLFGMATAFPVGVQSFVVLNQGLKVGYPRVLLGIVTASLCDTLLIVLGAAGAAAFLAAPGREDVLIFVGVTFLSVIGVMALRTPPEDAKVKSLTSPGAMVAQTVGVSLFNPHAIFETVGLIGGAIAAQAAPDRVAFAAGAISASWVWFVMIGLGASILQARLTPRVRLWTQRGSGAFMLVFAGILALELV